MIKIAKVVQDIMDEDDLASVLAQRGLLNYSAYAEEIKPKVDKILLKDVRKGTITTAISRHTKDLPKIKLPKESVIQSISIQTNLESISVERTRDTSLQIARIYMEIDPEKKSFLTITQGISEITVISDSSNIKKFDELSKAAFYKRSGLVGATVKFDLKYLNIPNLIYAFTKRLAVRNINVIEIVSTATELTFVIDKDDLDVALEQLQKDIRF